MALVLGISSIHPDAAAVLIDDKKGVIAAIAEERLNRKKHCAGFPSLATVEVLRIAGASMSDLTDVAIARDSSANLGAKLGFLARHPSSGLQLAVWNQRVRKRLATVSQLVAEACGRPEAEFKAHVHRVEHHLTHAASSFFWSKFERATGLTTDGSGDFCTGLIARCEGNKIDVLTKNYWPHSFGVFYTAVCRFLGFDKYGEEYKVMGLAAYGQDTYAKEMNELVWYTPAHGMRLSLKYFSHQLTAHTHQDRSDGEIGVEALWSPAMRNLFGPERRRNDPIEQRHMNIAASMQRRFEEVYIQYVQDGIRRNNGLRDVVIAGGCALNGVANGRLLVDGIVGRLYIHPAAGDDGAAAGAAAYVMHSVLDKPRLGEITNAYWGTGWSDAECEKALVDGAVPFRKLSQDELTRVAADALAQGKILGWFQGREEWGPRALGNRSILCHPGWPKMKETLNARVKNRETFRPFAPLCMQEHLGELFEFGHEVPFMNIVYRVKPEWRERLSATTHEDATGRVQTMRREQNELFYDLLTAFKERTGIPVLLNTSFNENEPIVHTPQQALACFQRTRMDALALGPFWCEKPA